MAVQVTINPSKKVRMEDIAREVGVSRVTVSMVLNNRGQELRISEKVQAEVWKAAQRLGYRPNVLARRLRSNDSHCLFIALATARQAPLTILSSVYQGADLGSSSSPVPIQLTVESFSQGDLKDLPGLLDASRFNGAIISNSAAQDEQFLDNQELPIPVIVFNRRMENVSYIDATNRASGQMAADLLIQQGRRNICILQNAKLTQSTNERRLGFIEKLEEAGFSLQSTIVGDTFSERGGYEGMAAFLGTRQPCDAVFAVGDYMALGAMHAIRKAGRCIPDDVAMIGHDDVDMASYSNPSLTTLHLPLQEMAQDAAATLVQILTGEVKGPVQRTYQTYLVRRESA
jgi:DNA-binding LacI/PurR family transcriptional regulator